MDWAPNSNRIVTCAGDRNAYVWNYSAESGTWTASLVLLRIDRAATYVRWSPAEDRFAVGSGARLLSICYYDSDHDWWVSKHIKKPLRSTILCVDWHPNNYLIAVGSCDFKCRVFSSALKELEDKPEVSGWMSKLSKFGTLLVEFSVSEGWVHGVKFSPSGDKLAWVAHDSSVNVVDMSDHTKVFRCLTSGLPMLSVIWINERSVVSGGHNNYPSLYNLTADHLVFGAKLDIKKKKSSGGMSAMARFKQLDDRGEDNKGTVLDTAHQNAVVELRVIERDGASGTKKFSSIGKDGKLIVWDVDVLASTIAELKI